MIHWSLALFFLLWSFILALCDLLPHYLGKGIALNVFRRKSFFYFPAHRFLFPRSGFTSLLTTFKIAEGIGTLGYAWSVLLFFLHHEFSLLYAFEAFLLFVVVAKLLPLPLIIHFKEKALLPFTSLLSCFLCLATPCTLILLKLLTLFLPEDEEEEGDIEEVQETILELLKEKHMLDTTNAKLIRSVVSFRDRIVREVMVPRMNLFALPVTTTLREAVHQLVEERYSRIPIYRENVDTMIGVLMYKDAMRLYVEAEGGKIDASRLDQPIETVVKNILYTPETKKVSRLLQEFRHRHMHLAIVVDEYGGTEGVVTIEDILEAIVGEIADEYDIGEKRLYTVQPGGKGWIVDARMNIFEAEELFGIHFPQEGEYDTIGGYAVYRMGTIPEKGVRIHHEEFDLEILESSERSVEQLRITLR